MVTAEQKASDLINFVAQGGTLIIATYTRAWSISPKTLASFNRAGCVPIIGRNGSLWMVNGHKKTCIDFCSINAA